MCVVVLEPIRRLLVDEGGGMADEVDEEREDGEGRAYVNQYDHQDCL
jgi:hypothetical protein